MSGHFKQTNRHTQIVMSRPRTSELPVLPDELIVKIIEESKEKPTTFSFGLKIGDKPNEENSKIGKFEGTLVDCEDVNGYDEQHLVCTATESFLNTLRDKDGFSGYIDDENGWGSVFRDSIDNGLYVIGDGVEEDKENDDLDHTQWEYELTQIGKVVPMMKKPLVRTIAKRFARYGQPERANVRWYLDKYVSGIEEESEYTAYTNAYKIS